MSKFELRDKVAIVTGGAGGIGTSVALEYSKAGAKVVVSSRKREKLDKVVAEIKELGGEALAIATDVCDANQVDSMVKQTVDHFGRLDILVNNAGGALYVKKALELTPEEWAAGITLNLTSPYLCSVAAAREMIPKKSGKIINISSVAGMKRCPSFPHYGAGKAGLINLTYSLAADWAEHNINVNCIAPGLTATQGIIDWGVLPSNKREDGTPVPPLQFPHDPEHVANLAVFLASEASDRLTGELIPIRAEVPSER